MSSTAWRFGVGAGVGKLSWRAWQPSAGVEGAMGILRAVGSERQ